MVNINIFTRVITSASANPIAVKSTGKCDMSHRLQAWLYFRMLGRCILLSWLSMLLTKAALEMLQDSGLPKS